jgi:hypothetical protein
VQDVSIDVGSAFPYMVDRFLAIFGKDAITREAEEFVRRLFRVATEQAALVQIIGMDKPVPILSIYQPTRLMARQQTTDTTVTDVLEAEQDVIIFGGPGRGKTVLAHYLFATLGQTKRVPILITLRWPTAVTDLRRIVELLENDRLRRLKWRKVVLIVDGYDEIDTDSRIAVTASLREFVALEIGTFLLTCRSFYDVVDLKAFSYDIAPFTLPDQML